MAALVFCLFIGARKGKVDDGEMHKCAEEAIAFFAVGVMEVSCMISNLKQVSMKPYV